MRLPTKLLLTFVVLAVLIQLYPLDRSVPEYSPTADFMVLHQVPPQIEQLVKGACYDCHSYATRWPWYSRIAPISWIVQNHVQEGRDYFNYNTWGRLSTKKQRHLLEEMVEEIEEEEMPLSGYVRFHPEAQLSESEKDFLIQWFKSQSDALGI